MSAGGVNNKYSSISRRIIFYIILSSSCITLIFTGFQIFNDYQNELNLISEKHNQITTVHVGTITTSLWATDTEKLKTIIAGISTIQDLKYAAIIEKDELLVSFGEYPNSPNELRSIPLSYQHRGELLIIGQLDLAFDIEAIYSRLKERVLYILITNALKTTLIAGFIFFIFQRMVTRHLKDISKYVSAVRIATPYNELKLNRKPKAQNDELSLVTNTINKATKGMLVDVRKIDDARKRFQDFAATSSDWFWEMDDKLCFSYISDRYLEITDLNEQDIYQKSASDIINPRIEDTASMKWVEFFSKLKKELPFKNFEYKFKTKSGEIFYFSISGAPYYCRKGVFQGYRGTGSDITELVSTTAQLRQAQRMEAIGQLTGGVSHDFNNILGIIVGNSDILKSLITDKKITHRLNVIKKAANRGASLCYQLLSFSRKQNLIPTDIDLKNLIIDIEDMLQRTLGVNVVVKTYYSPDLWHCSTDPSQLTNAIINLAVNARDAMSEGGLLTIEATNRTIRVGETGKSLHLKPGEYVQLKVTDTGHGISSEVLEKVFEPFYTTKEIGEGSGLGLSMVYGFVKQSNGSVIINSETNKGTVVSLFLPKSYSLKSPALHPKKNETPQEFRNGSERILIVEDDNEVREVSTYMLKDQGYEVIEAKNGIEAQEYLKAGVPYDLLFTDIILPGELNGIEIAEQAEHFNPKIKVLFTTGYSEETITKKNKSMSGCNVLKKPFQRAELLEIIQNLLDE